MAGRPVGAKGAAPLLTGSPWLVRVPAGLFAMPVGLFGLAGAWRRAAAFGWPLAAPVGDALAGLALALFLLLLALYLAKALRHPRAVAGEYQHPVAGALMALVPLSLLLAVAYYGVPREPAFVALAIVALAMQGVVAMRVVRTLATGELPATAVTPALYLPPTAGGFVGGMALGVLGYPGWAALLFGMGLASWALLEVRVLNRLFEGPMPEQLRPTIGVEIAPPSVATLAAGAIWPALPGEVLIVGLGIAAGPVVAVLARYRWWSQTPFGIGFWSFSFPLAALAGAVIEVVRRGGWPPSVGGIALAIASLAVAYLAVRTLALLVRGRILPAPPAAPTIAPQRPTPAEEPR
jgi:tellurite resistance protein